MTDGLDSKVVLAKRVINDVGRFPLLMGTRSSVERLGVFLFHFPIGFFAIVLFRVLSHWPFPPFHSWVACFLVISTSFWTLPMML